MTGSGVRGDTPTAAQGARTPHHTHSPRTGPWSKRFYLALGKSLSLIRLSSSWKTKTTSARDMKFLSENGIFLRRFECSCVVGGAAERGYRKNRLANLRGRAGARRTLAKELRGTTHLQKQQCSEGWEGG